MGFKVRYELTVTRSIIRVLSTEVELLLEFTCAVNVSVKIIRFPLQHVKQRGCNDEYVHRMISWSFYWRLKYNNFFLSITCIDCGT